MQLRCENVRAVPNMTEGFWAVVLTSTGTEPRTQTRDKADRETRATQRKEAELPHSVCWETEPRGKRVQALQCLRETKH
jgi:hypothetical protein